MDWKFPPYGAVCLGSIALSPRSDLGLTPVLERLALVSSASVTISRKLYPMLPPPNPRLLYRHTRVTLHAAFSNSVALEASINIVQLETHVLLAMVSR